MREIKFRAWDTNRKLMIGTDYKDNWGDEIDEWYADEYLMMLEGIEDISKDERFKLMQYTGLKDKNGKEIYEGDLLKNGGDNKPGEVNYKDGCFFVGKYSCELWRYSGDNKEVIGNIYENPELIEKI